MTIGEAERDGEYGRLLAWQLRGLADNELSGLASLQTINMYIKSLIRVIINLHMFCDYMLWRIAVPILRVFHGYVSCHHNRVSRSEWCRTYLLNCCVLSY